MTRRSKSMVFLMLLASIGVIVLLYLSYGNFLRMSH